MGGLYTPYLQSARELQFLLIALFWMGDQNHMIFQVKFMILLQNMDVKLLF